MSEEQTQTGSPENDAEAPERRPFLDPVRIGLLGIIVIIAFLLLGFGLPLLNRSSDAPESIERAQVIDPPQELQNFTLTGTDGEQVSLSDFQGTPVLLFFGYTHCPDVCPATLADFRQIKRELGDEGDEVSYVFISVDGTRDTPEIVDEFVSRFDSSFVGLTGTEEDVRIVGQDYFLYFQQTDADTASASGYLVDHTASSYLIDQQGRLRYIYPFDVERETVVEDLQEMLN